MGAQRDNLRSRWRRGGNNDKRSFVDIMFWGCFKASLFIFGTNCFFWLLCFVGTTAQADETQQQQSNAEQTSHGTSAPAAPHAGSATTMEPLLQEVVGKGEAEEEDFPVQCAIAASLSQQPAASSKPEPEPEPEPEPNKEQDTQTEIAQAAKAKGQKTEHEGEGGCVAAGFVEVVMDSDE